MFEELAMFAYQSHQQSIYAYGLMVLAVVIGCSATLGALTQALHHKLATRKVRC